MAHIVVIAQARMGSSRLPGKVLAKAGDRSLLEHLIRRVQRATRPHALIIATTTHPGDDPVATEATRCGADSFRGSEHDVLARYHGAAVQAGATIVVRVTGDCPLIDPTEIDRVIDLLDGPGSPVDYATNQAGEDRTIPRGLDVEAFTMAALTRAFIEASKPGEREHVTPYLYNTPGRFNTRTDFGPGPDLSHLRLTVDTPADLALIRAIFDALGDDATTDQVASMLATRPDLATLNHHIKQRPTDHVDTLRRDAIQGRLLLARADAGDGLGFGHVARLEAILDAWISLGGRAAIRGSGITGSVRQRLLDLGVDLHDVTRDHTHDPSLTVEQRGHATPPDLASTLALAQSLDAAAIAIDGYAFTHDYQRALAQHHPLLAIDDLASFPMVADVVVNPNMGFDPGRYDAPPSTTLCVGHAFTPFRREFRDAPTQTPPEKTHQRVVVTFGGADIGGLTLPVTQALLSTLPAEVSVDVIAGGRWQERHTEAIATLVQTHGQRLRIHTNVQHMAALMRGATCAVSAAGSTTWELMTCAVPVLLIATADNQRVVMAGASNANAAIPLGWHTDLSPDTIAAHTRDLLNDPARRTQLAQRGKALIDGRGVFKTIDALLTAIDSRITQDRETLT